MATLPPVKLGVTIFSAFLFVLALRKPIERRAVLPAPETSQPKRQFFVDLSLCLAAGILTYAYNATAFGFPFISGIILMIGNPNAVAL